ncbi:hypothetical protein HF086_009654 [Spodoptera exigua]|uniref:Uncharacterized protein n=1 Tax=Spodoptera exigua TaxID=7107 RepID=A0A922SLJ4_SPOEX|nr:hypothetical protein HF086_009654 [Spodoptera exigua]
MVSKSPVQMQEASQGEGDGGTKSTQSVIVIAPTSGSSRPSEGRETLWLRGVIVTSAQPLRHPDVRVLRPAALAGRVQQPARVVVPPARGLPAAVLWVPAAAGPRLVEVPTALS